MELENFLIKYKDKVKNNILNIVITVIALNIAVNVFKSQNKTINSLKSQISNERKKNELLIDLGQTEEKFHLYKISFKKRNFPQIVKAFNSMEKKFDLEIVDLKPKKEESGPEYNKYPFSLSIKAGDYHRIGKFLNLIESARDIFFIESLIIEKVASSPEEQEAGEMTYRLKSDMSLCLFALKE